VLYYYTVDIQTTPVSVDPFYHTRIILF